MQTLSPMALLTLLAVHAVVLCTAAAAPSSATPAIRGEDEGMMARDGTVVWHTQGLWRHHKRHQHQEHQSRGRAGMRMLLSVDAEGGGARRRYDARVKRAKKLRSLTAQEWEAANTKFDLIDGETAKLLWRSKVEIIHHRNHSPCQDTACPHSQQHMQRMQVRRPNPASIRISPRPVISLSSRPDSQRLAHAPSRRTAFAANPLLMDAGVCVQMPGAEMDPGPRTATAAAPDGYHGTASSAKCETVACLPSFLIIGVMKGGTAEVQNWLGKHPLLRRWGGPWISGAGEAHFFDAIDSDEHLQNAWFPHYLQAGLCLNHTADATGVYTFEKSPSYFFMRRERIERLRRVLPNVKLLLLLRSPIARAYSHFQHNCAKRRLWKVANRTRIPAPLRGRVISAPSSIRGSTNRRRVLAARFVQGAYHTDAIAPADLQLLEYPCSPETFDVFLKMRHDGSYNAATDIRMDTGNGMVLRRGLYARALRKWLRVFDRSQLLTLISEDLRVDMVAAIARIESFLGLPHANYEAHVRRDARGYAVLDTLHSKAHKHAYVPMLPASRYALARFFQEDTRTLLSLLGSSETASILRHWGVTNSSR